MQRILLPGLLVALLLTFAGCELPLIYSPGATLSVNDDGHFQETMVYSIYDRTYTYGSDGSYLYEEKDYENLGADLNDNGKTGEGWVQTGGNRGTYTWDPETLMVRWNYTGYYGDTDTDVVGSGYAWRNTDYGYQTNHLFTAENIYYVYLDAGNDRWVRENGHFSSATDTTPDPGETTYVIEPGRSLSHETEEFRGSPGAYTYGMQYEWLYSYVDSTPEGREWRDGNVVTFHVVRTGSRYRYMDTSTQQWQEWSYYDSVTESWMSEADANFEEYNTRLTFWHSGDYMLSPTLSSARAMEPANLQEDPAGAYPRPY